MDEKRYVQHISGQGEKWEVNGECGDQRWYVLAKDKGGYLSLPKSEYRLCDPPERWVDVTGECELEQNGVAVYDGHSILETSGYADDMGYRLRKVLVSYTNKEDPLVMRVMLRDRPAQYAFLVEKKVSQ